MVAVYPSPLSLPSSTPTPSLFLLRPSSPLPAPSAQSLSASDKPAKMAARKLFISGNRFWPTRTLGFCSRRRTPWLRQMALALISEMLQCFISIYAVDTILLFVLSEKNDCTMTRSCPIIRKVHILYHTGCRFLHLEYRFSCIQTWRILLLIVPDIIPDFIQFLINASVQCGVSNVDTFSQQWNFSLWLFGSLWGLVSVAMGSSVCSYSLFAMQWGMQKHKDRV